MSGKVETHTNSLRRELGFRDLVLFSIAGIVGTRWLAAAAQTGASAVVLWFAAALLFFLPGAYCIARLSARFPLQGGMYVWTRECFGDWHGFLCFWIYWTGIAFWFPSALLAYTSMACYAFGPEYVHLADSRGFVVAASLVMIWGGIGLNIVGLRFGKWLDNLGGVAVYALGIVLVVVAALLWRERGSASPLSFRPQWNWQQLNFFSQMTYALTGLELAPILAGEIRDPARNLPRSALAAAPIATVFYASATLAVIVILPAGGISPIHGVAQSALAAGESLGVSWLPRLAAILILTSALGQLSVLGASAARLPYAVGTDHMLPAQLASIHPRWGTPYVSLLFFGVIATVFLVVTQLGDTLRAAYQTITDLMVIAGLIPFLYIFLAAWKCGSRWSAALGLLMSGLSICLSVLPTADIVNVPLFEAKLFGMTALLIAAGRVLFVSMPAHGRRSGRF